MFAQETGTGAIKIGCSATPKERVSGLQTACPHRLSMLGIIKGDENREAELHSRFADKRLTGEWFSNAILAEVETIIAREGIQAKQ